jgi:hypothetical protein
MEPEGSLPCPQEPFPKLLWSFVTSLFFYGEALLAPCPTRKVEGHPLPAVRYFLFNIYSQLPSISGGRLLHPQPENPPNLDHKFHVILNMNSHYFFKYG